MALVGSFEQFCLRHLAVTVNINPRAIDALQHRWTGPLMYADKMPAFLHSQPGFLFAEHFHMGSPYLLNALFEDLLGVSLLSRDDVAHFNDMLNDRDLLVSCDIAMPFLGLPKVDTPSPQYITPDEFRSWCAFLGQIAERLNRQTCEALASAWTSDASDPGDVRRQALAMLG